MPHIEIPLEKLAVNTPIRIENGDSGIVVIMGEDEIRAYEDRCPHAGWRLSDGEVSGNCIECPGHGWQFDTATGQCINVPAYRLRRYDVSVASGIVRVHWDEPAGQLIESVQAVASL